MAFDALPGDSGTAPAAPMSLELPAGGQMRELAVSPTDGAWYVLSYFGGMFRSLDQGASWVPCGSVPAQGVEVAVDGTVWAAGPDVYASTDDCATWTATGAPKATLDIGIYGSEVWAVGDGGIWLRTGTTWTQRTTPVDGALFSRFGGQPGTARVAGTYGSGIVTSPDGITWTQRTGLASTHVNDIASSPTRLIVYSGADMVSNGGAACATTATGTAWSVCYNAGGISLAIDPVDDQHIVFGIYDDLAETPNNFTNVQRDLRSLSGLDESIIREMQYTSAGTLILASERGVFASTTRPLAFQPAITGISAWTIDGIVRDGDDVFLTSDAGVLRSVAGAPYTISTTGMKYATRADRIAFAPDGTLIAPGRCLRTSTDRGETWNQVYCLLQTDGYNANAVAFVGTRAVVGTDTRVVTSDPPYDTWTPHAVGAGSVYVADVAVAGTTVYLATNGGLYVSTDDGATSQPVAAVPTGSNAITILDDATLIIGTETGIRVGYGTGPTWESHLGTSHIDDVVADGRLVVAIASFDDAAFISYDSGRNWLTVPTPPGVHLATAAFDTDGSLVLGTYGFGLIRVALP